MKLSELNKGEKATITKVLGHGAFRRRIMEMGFVRGKEVTSLHDAPLRDPVVYNIMGYEVSLRVSEAELIEVISSNEVAASVAQSEDVSPIISDEIIAQVVDKSAKHINIALVGNPNSGKTSLFNMASGGHEHVGNYSGVTVDAKRGEFKFNDYTFNIYDLPGTYSLSGYSPEELFVRRHIAQEQPDIILNIIAASNLERNLYLTTELIDMDNRMVIAMNMYDELLAQGASLDYHSLAKMIGVPIVPTNSRSKEGFNELFSTIIDVYEGRNSVVRHIHVNHGLVLEKSISAVREVIREDSTLRTTFSSRYLAIKALSGDSEVERILSESDIYSQIKEQRDKEVKRVEHSMDEDIESCITSQKYGFIDGAISEVYKANSTDNSSRTNIIDRVVTDKFWGFPIFLAIMWLMFTTTFILGAYPMEWIEMGIAWFADIISSLMGDTMVRDLIVDGIIGGVGGVLVFLPNIVILYMFISFMENTGYMARAAFIMDKLMHYMGLHGKSFIPSIMGFGCNVPAIMATRSIESPSSRLITILINPFFSCSARLPVYLLFVGAFFPNNSGTVLFLIYLVGIAAAILTAKLLRVTSFKKEDTPFVMELPPYRLPTLRSTMIHMWDKSYQYLRKMGGVILIASIIIWLLSYFPRNESLTPIEQQRHSYLGQIGETCSPVMKPLGFDWRATVAIFSSMAAKEIAVTTMAVLYNVDNGSDDMDEDAINSTLSERLKETNPQTGKPFFTWVTALSFMIFVLLCFPCLASLAAIHSETGTWWWVAFSVTYNTSLAWLVAWLVTLIF
ncbi:MAG: ferrous iron transport protein B [Rikenellaceae bacterium]